MKTGFLAALHVLVLGFPLPSFGGVPVKQEDIAGRWVGCFGYVLYQLTLDHGRFDFDYFDDGGDSYKKSGSYSIKAGHVRLEGRWPDKNDDWVLSGGKLWRADMLNFKGSGRKLVLYRPVEGCR